MRVRVVEPGSIDSAAIAEAAAVLRNGGLVAFPTETVYGLGADATNATAVSRIFTAKGRPAYNPLIVHVPDVESARDVVSGWPETARVLATRFWPGPLTLVLPRQPRIPDIVTAGLPTVGVRVPAHPVALALLRAAGIPVAAPSANRSMAVSPTTGGHVVDSLGEGADLVLDAGPSSVGIESTVLDLSGATPTILRAGMIGRAELSEVIGEVRLATANAPAGEARPSPGMMDRHYSPRARVILVRGSAADVAVRAAAEARDGRRVVLIARSAVEAPGAVSIVMPADPSAYARQLYATLHGIDRDGFEVAVIEDVPPDDAWDGIRDRLSRAATSSSS